MLRRLWIRWLCYWNDVCPKHGVKDRFYGPVSGSGSHLYCGRCREEAEAEWNRKVKWLVEEVKKEAKK